MSNRRQTIRDEIVEESSKTKKTRDKLKQHLEKSQEKINPAALEKKSSEIARWIERYAQERVSVKKNISLFDQNRNPAKMSKNTEKLAQGLALQLQESRELLSKKRKFNEYSDLP